MSETGGARPRITYVGHATVAVEVAGTTILTDPVLTNRLKHLRRVVPPAAGFDPASVDVVVISHQHHDHLHIPSVKRLPRTAHAVVPVGMGERLRKLGFERVDEVAIGASAGHGPVTIRAVPANHDDGRHPGVPRVDPIGFVIEAGEWSCYFPGDTDIFPEMVDIDADLDVALIPVWGWGPTLGGGHLDPAGAAEALELLGASTAIPIHWGTMWPYHVRQNDRLVEPPKELAAAVAARGLDVEVVEVPPGHAVTV